MMTVDPRIGSGELFGALKKLGVPVRKKHMRFGDFRFRSGPGYDPDTDGSVLVGVERKKTSELLGAVQDSRFRRHQVQGLLTRYRSHAWLLVEGAYEPNREGVLQTGKMITTSKGKRMTLFWEAGFTKERHVYENFAKFQTTLQIKARMQYMRTISEIETVHWLAALYRWYQKPYKDHKSVYVVDETKPDAAVLSADTFQRRVIAQFPGVGWDRSKKVVRYMREHQLSVSALTAKGVKAWREALGFKEGTEIAAKVVDFLTAVDDRP